MSETFSVDDWLEMGKNDTIITEPEPEEDLPVTKLTNEQTEALQEIETFWRTQIALLIMAQAPAESDLPATRATFRQCADIALGKVSTDD